MIFSVNPLVFTNYIKICLSLLKFDLILSTFIQVKDEFLVRNADFS